MIRLHDIVLISAAIAGAVWTYQIKHDAELSAQKLNVLRSQIAAQDRKIALLEADWALETSPSRLEMIASKFSNQLNLAPMKSSQIIGSSELPGLRVDRDSSDEEIFAGKTGETLTGGIEALIERGGEN